VAKSLRYWQEIQHAREVGALDPAVAALAHRQRGYVGRQQLLALGLGEAAIQYRVSVGRLIVEYAGVYAVGHRPVLPIDRAAGAVLACGPDAALSHGSAVALWGWEKRWRAPFDVTATSHRRRDGIRVHRSATLTARDVTTHYGIRVTSPARTILDATPRYTDKRLTRLLNDARRSNYLNLGDLYERLQRCPRHPGAKRLRRLLVTAPHRPTRSEFEDAFLAFARRYGLPMPEVNFPMGRRELDIYYPNERVIIELDGWDFHGTKASFEDDRERDADHLALGIVTVRITWERLISAPEKEARRLRAILEQRRRQAA
jgi:very-short-patch-repair endonuclease